MKKLFKNVKVNEKGIKESMEKTMEEVASQIIEEHFANEDIFVNSEEDTIQFDEIEQSEELDETIQEINDEIIKGLLKEAYNKGRNSGIRQACSVAIVGFTVGAVALAKFTK